MRWFNELSRAGTAEGGGFFRASYTPGEAECHRLLTGWMEDCGLQVERDAVGNLWGKTEGSIAGAPPVVTGSHMDSVRNGGNYDGVYGVLGGLRAIKDLLEKHGKPRIPIEVVAFTGEEGSRFPIVLMGSRGAAGSLDVASLDAVKDGEGVSLADAMTAAGLDPARAGEAARGKVGAYLEMHIEQGPVLEQTKTDIGIVRAIVGFQQFRVTMRGEAGHAGTTPMRMRRDPMQWAARAIMRFPDIATRSGDGVITVGKIAASPGAENVIPGEVTFSIDIRHPVEETKQEMARAARAACEEEALSGGGETSWISHPNNLPTAMDAGLRELMRTACEKLGYRHLDMPSGAGHDAVAMARLGRPGMLFIPCKGGRSHCPEEYASPEDMMRGVSVLTECLHSLAYGDASGLAHG